MVQMCIRDRDKSVSEGDIKSWQSGLPDFATENADVRAKLVEWQTSWTVSYTHLDVYKRQELMSSDIPVVTIDYVHDSCSAVCSNNVKLSLIHI